MSDLVQRLHTFWPNGFDQGDVPKICEEAADRIEVLEAALRWIGDASHDAKVVARRALVGKP